MEMKVNDISQISQVPEAAKTVEGDGSFKFTLASAITDADLQAKVDELLSDITAQGNRLAEHMDIREITEKLQIAESTVKTQRQRAKQYLRKRLKNLYTLVIFLFFE